MFSRSRRFSSAVNLPPFPWPSQYGTLSGSDNLDDSRIVGRAQTLGLPQQVELFCSRSQRRRQSGHARGPTDDAHVLDKDVQPTEHFRAVCRVSLKDAWTAVGK